MHEAVSGQRSRRPSLTPSARAARGLATSAAAAAPTLRRRIASRFASFCSCAGDAAVRVQLLNASQRWNQAASCNAMQRCAWLRIISMERLTGGQVLHTLAMQQPAPPAAACSTRAKSQECQPRCLAKKTAKTQARNAITQDKERSGMAPAGQSTGAPCGARLRCCFAARTIPRGRSRMLSRRCGA